MKLLSIVIASNNRPELLKKCLDSIIPQRNKNIEIIVVDNHYKQAAKKVINKFKNVKYLFEKEISPAAARNNGIKKAKGKYIVFVDDDSIVNKQFIESIIKIINKKPKIKAFGGSYSRHSNKKIPFWFLDNYGVLNNGDSFKNLQIGEEWLSGTNMIFEKNLLLKFNGFNKKFGMKKGTIYYGEETDLLIRLALADIPIYYDPKIKVSHLLADKKINLIWLIKDAFRRGQSTHYIQNKYPEIFTTKSQTRKTPVKQNFAQKIVSLILLVSFGLGKNYAKIN